MNYLIKEKKLPLIILLIVSMLFCKSSWSNPGLGIAGTYVLENSQYPAALKKNNPSAIYIIFDGSYAGINASKTFLNNDTIVNLKGFLDSAKGGAKAYRLIFERNQNIDSVWQTDTKFQITDKAYNLGNDKLQIYAYDLGLSDKVNQ